MWDANFFQGRQPLAVFNGTGTLADRFYCVAVSHDGARVVGGTLSNAILVYQVEPPRPVAICILNGHTNHVTKLRFGPLGSPAAYSLFSCSKDHKVRRWNIATQQCEKVYEGNTFYSKAGGTSAAKIKQLDGKRGHSNEVHDLAFSPDGRYMCTVGHRGIMGSDRDQTKLWDLHTGNCLYNYKGHTHDVFAVVASFDGKRFYTAGSDNMIKTWIGNPDITSESHQESRKLKEYRIHMFSQTVITTTNPNPNLFLATHCRDSLSLTFSCVILLAAAATSAGKEDC
jgi:WD40 repeat protein